MTRERSTWNINNIAKEAGLKLADPYTMNQDHVRQQPAADAYVTGDPSSFGEDIHPAAGTWEAEYSGGQVKRNEIGMPEMRNDTFNHPEKTASEEVLVKKAAVCVALARTVLPKTASPMDIEEQSISFMHLPDEELMSTFTRLAAKQDQQQDQQQQVQAAQQDQQGQQQQQEQKQAAKQDQQQDQQQVQAAKQDQQGQQDQQQVQAAQQAQQDQGKQDQQQVQAAQQPFSDPRHTSVRALLAQDQQGQQAQQDQTQQQKEAGQEQQAQMQQQLAQMIQQAQQQLDKLQAQQQQVQAPPAQQQGGEQAGQQQQQAGQQQAQMQQQSQAQQVAQAVQQAIQNGQDPVAAAAACMGQSQQQAGGDGELIDQMLAQQQQVQPMANMDIELDTPTMDVGEVQLGPEDDMLMQLFANAETEQAQQAQDGGQQQQKQAHAVRTASMRTVGTVPSQGVSRIGGTSTAKVASGGSDQLSSLWSSAPDVRDAFGIPTNQ